MENIKHAKIRRTNDIIKFNSIILYTGTHAHALLRMQWLIIFQIVGVTRK